MGETNFKYTITKVKGFSCPSKLLLKINGTDICFAKGRDSLAKIVGYAYTHNKNDLEDKSLRDLVDLALNIKGVEFNG